MKKITTAFLMLLGVSAIAQPPTGTAPNASTTAPAQLSR